jgi:Xaa-Pro aminopeptidase
MDRLLPVLDSLSLDALLIADVAEVRWLTGFPSSNAVVVVTRDRAVLVTDFRYATRAARLARDVEVVEGQRDLLGDVVALLPEGGRVGFEDHVVTVDWLARLRKVADGRELVGVGDAVVGVRAVKTAPEISLMRAAVACADAALAAVLERGVVGRRELEVAAELEAELRRQGAQRSSFDPIVAAGPRADSPHGEPTDAVIERGTLLLIDFGVELDGWCSDGTRTYATGSVSDEMRSIYELVLSAQLAGLDAVRAGVSGRSVDSVARQLITDAGFGERFGHSLGHGVGVRIHEEPRLAQGYQGLLEPGNVVSVEPGVYLPGRFGVRIEDLVAVTADGCDNLSSLPKELVVVD